MEALSDSLGEQAWLERAQEAIKAVARSIPENSVVGLEAKNALDQLDYRLSRYRE